MRTSALIRRLVPSIAFEVLAMSGIPPIKPNSNHHPDRVASILATGLSDEQLKLIGEIAVLWNSAQARFQQLIWIVGGWGDLVGGLVTADMTAISLVQLAKNIIAHKTGDAEVRKYADATISLFDEVRIARNKTIHGLPVLDEKRETEMFRMATAKRGTGDLAISMSRVTVAELTSLKDDVCTLALAVEGSIFQFFTLQLMEMGGLARTHYRQNLERALLIELSHLQTRLDALRLRRSIEGNTRSQPQSSGA